MRCHNGHPLQQKTVSGSFFEFLDKKCRQCGKLLHSGQPRFSCKSCQFHLCGTCARLAATVAPAPAPAAVGVPGYPVPLILGPSAPPATPSQPSCKWGAECYNHDPEHRRKFAHPCLDEAPVGKRTACKYGSKCYQRDKGHLARFAHPGDRNYRMGLVVFPEDQSPEFESMWQLFRFHDPDESGHLSKDEFAMLLKQSRKLVPSPTLDEPEVWKDVSGDHGYVSFRMFTAWASKHLELDLPLGLESSDASSRPCRFRLGGDGERCSCDKFQGTTHRGEEAGSAQLCVCGHKISMHRSDLAMRTMTDFLEETGPAHWTKDMEGLVQVLDPDVLSNLQELMDHTHKSTDNWTRDRGCTLHGVNGPGCSLSCASKNRVPVPKEYRLHSAFRNQNQDLWHNYSLVKTAIGEECHGPSKVKTAQFSVQASARWVEGEPLDASINEWYLFHGSKPEALSKILESNFRLTLAGSGATWKETGKPKGLPLYGFGLYFAECITKADEYAHPVQEGDLLPIEPDAASTLYAVLLCRVIGGRTNLVDTDEIKPDKLRTDVFDGPFHSVFGDRVSTLGKPYKEVVVYDKDQTFPEYLLVYSRKY